MVYIFLLCCSLSANSQRGKTLFSKGLDRFVQDKEEAALRYFKKSIRIEPENKASSLNFIADIEYKKGDRQGAEIKYKSILTTFKDNDHYLQYRVNLKLADIYIERADYPGALNYLRASEEHKYKFGCGTGKYEQEYELRYKYALCFSALDQPDSGIMRLSTFVFKDRPLLTGLSEHAERNKFYYGLLVKKYGECEVKDETIKALSNLNYSNRFDSSWYPDPKMKRIQCSLVFFGETIPILDLGYTGPADFYPYSKQGCLERIRKSSLYQLIMGGTLL